jgi:hypothetical protein
MYFKEQNINKAMAFISRLKFCKASAKLSIFNSQTPTPHLAPTPLPPPPAKVPHLSKPSKKAATIQQSHSSFSNSNYFFVCF